MEAHEEQNSHLRILLQVTPSYSILHMAEYRQKLREKIKRLRIAKTGDVKLRTCNSKENSAHLHAESVCADFGHNV